MDQSLASLFSVHFFFENIIGGSTVVEPSTTDLVFKGSNPSCGLLAMGEMVGKKILKEKQRIKIFTLLGRCYKAFDYCNLE
jgi:hypothetical protein